MDTKLHTRSREYLRSRTQIDAWWAFRPYDNNDLTTKTMMITQKWWFIFTPSMSNIVSLHKKAKQSFILSRPFLLSLFAFPLFIPVKISSSIGFHNQFEFICFVVDLWIQCWMLNKKSCWQRQIYYFSFLFYSNCLILSTMGKDCPNKSFL